MTESSLLSPAPRPRKASRAPVAKASNGFNRRDWKAAICWLVFWSYAYALLIHKALEWICIFLTAFSAQIFGAPVAIPVPAAPDWSLLLSATGTLMGIGGIEAVRDRTKQPPAPKPDVPSA